MTRGRRFSALDLLKLVTAPLRAEQGEAGMID
jgi:hypothetical protein